MRPAGGVVRRAGANLAPLLTLAALLITLQVIAGSAPLKVEDLRLVALHTVIVGTSAMGLCVIMVAGGIDLSVGSLLALSSVAAAKAAKAGDNPGYALLAAVGVGAACGLYNGVLVAGLRLPSFIATLGTLGFFRGAAKWWSGSRQVAADPGYLAELVRPTPTGWAAFLLVAPAVWITLCLAAFTAFVLKRTVFGRNATAIGSNEEAARRSGIAMGRTKALTFVLGGSMIGLAGCYQFARLTLGDPTVAVGLELQAIAAVVIGGGSLAGGHVSVSGALAGAALMALLNNRCTALQWPNYVQEMVVGHIIILAVLADRWRSRARAGGAPG